MPGLYPIRPLVDVRRGNSHIPLATRRDLWKRRRELIARLVAAGLLPPGPALAALATHLVPNPWTRTGGVVWKHSPLKPVALEYQRRNPVGFADSFVLPTWQAIEELATALRLGEVRAPHGSRASPEEALLVVLYRLRRQGSFNQLAEHAVF